MSGWFPDSPRAEELPHMDAAHRSRQLVRLKGMRV